MRRWAVALALLGCDPGGAEAPTAQPGGDAALADTGAADRGPTDASPADQDAVDQGPADQGAADQDPADSGPPFAACPPGATLAASPLTVPCADHVLTVTPGPAGVRLRRHAADAPPSRSWAVPADAWPVAPHGVARADGEAIVLCTDGWALTVHADCGTTLTDVDGAVLRTETLPTPGATTAALPPDTRLFGFGARGGALDRRGRTLTCRGVDAYDPDFGGYGPGQDPLYLCVPFYQRVDGAGRALGVFLDNAFTSTLDATAPDAVTLRAAGGELDLYLLPGPDLAGVLDGFTALTGRPARPPRWALGYHQSRWGWPDAATVRAIAHGFRDRDLPVDALWLDIQHMHGFRSFTFDPEHFPDPEGLVGDLAALGVRTVAIADPGLKVDEGWPVFTAARDQGLLLRWPDGRLFTGQAWPGESAWPDFTLPAARAFWAAQVQALAERGVHGIWLDVNEPTLFPESGGEATVDDAIPLAGDGRPTTMAEGHNVYALQQARATAEGLRAARPGERPFVLSRAGFAGTQAVAGHWTGDAPSAWWALAESLPMMLGVGLSGQPFTGTDIGGYSGGASPELFARWMALGVISPFMRGHFTSGVAGQEPWMFGPEVLAISRAFLQLRVRLLPYLEGLFDAAHATGAPVLRPVAWHFPEHPPADDLALLGPWLLAAPVLAEGATDRPLDLPPGRWLDWWSGRVIQGPARITPSVRLAALPLFLREGAIVPTGPAARSAAEAAGPLTLELFPGPTPTRQTRVLDGGGEAVGHIEYVLSPRADGFSLSAAGDAPPAGPLHLRIRPLDQPPTAVTLDGLPVADVRHDPQDRSLWLTVPDVAAFTLVITGAAQGPEPAWVEVPFEVQVPEDTPRDRPVHIASSVDGWQVHHPLAWQADGTAAGTLRAPRGEWFDYKFSRGDWPTVEKWPDCEEADNRYGLAAAWPPRAEQVFAWRDRCEAP